MYPREQIGWIERPVVPFVRPGWPMDFVVLIVLVAALVKGASYLGITFGRSGPAGLLRGMFSAPSLDWPHGVQEEDRERIWSWEAPPTEPPAEELPDAEVVEITEKRVPVQRVR